MTPDVTTFSSAGVRCEAWHFRAAHEDMATASGRPVVVMAHGFGGTRDTGLEPFARALADAGADVLAFDYRGFGGSAGEPRQRISLPGQVADYRAALEAAARLPGVDPGRLVLWGVSLSGGTVLEVAAGRDDVAAVIALTPLVSGPAAARAGMPLYETSTSARSAWHGLRARLAGALGQEPVRIPIVGDPEEAAVLALPGMKTDYLSIAGPTWRNEVDAGIVLDVVRHRPARFAHQLACPALFQIADFDRCAPPHAAMQAAFDARALVHHYPGDHFDVYAGKTCHHAVVAHQVRFLRRVLGAGSHDAAELTTGQSLPDQSVTIWSNA